ncbi:MAG: hypothetical protein KC996_05595 [Phycisphaerales bacterium]|nr:hypothetical protein [Phycisphaerales bacterium]
MPLSHHCISCGTDLSWIRAIPDPVYQLPVVVCPSCSTACTRSKPAISIAIRRFKAARRTGLVLLVELLMLTLLVGMSVGILVGLADDTPGPLEAIGVLGFGLTGVPNTGTSNTSFERDLEMIRTILVVLVLVSVGAGVWIRSAHGHLRLWSSVAFWFGLVLGLLAIIYIWGVIDQLMAKQSIRHLTPSHELGAAAVYLLFTVPFVAAGFPLGARARKIWIKQHRAKAHKYRRKLRKHRMNHARPADR